MKGLLLAALVTSVLSTAPAMPAQAQGNDGDVQTILKEIEETIFHYRAWLDAPSIVSVVKGTSHAARATAFLDTYLDEYASDDPEKEASDRRVGIRGIRSLLLKQMRIHVELLSTSVPVGIVEYKTSIESTLTEQLTLLEQTVLEYKRHQSGS